MSLLALAGTNSATGGYEIDNSLKLEDDNTENLYRALNVSTSTTKFTVSMWAKRTEINAPHLLYMRGVAGNESAVLRFATESASYPEALQVDIGAGGTNSRSYTKASFRDTSAWYHIVLAVDTTQSTATDRFKLYVNGVLETEYASRNNPAQNFAMEVSGAKHRHGAYNDTDGFAGYCGYIAECHYVDGLQVAQTEFGEFDDDSGIWKPKAYSGSYGTGGYYLDFSDSSALGNNSAGDGTDFTLNNITAADQATDTPTNNFCTMNPYAPYLYRIIVATDFTNGATQVNKTNANAWCGAIGTMGVKSGKWYYEARVNDSDNLMLGFSTFTGNTGANQSPHTIGTNIVWYGGGASGSYWFYHIDSGSQVSNASNRGTVWSNGDVLGVALDIDNSRIDFYVNGSLAGSSNTNVDISATVNEIDSTGDFLIPFIGMWRSEFRLNFGGYTTISISSAASDENGYGTFEYAPPSGYYALCTKNLEEFG